MFERRKLYELTYGIHLLIILLSEITDKSE